MSLEVVFWGYFQILFYGFNFNHISIFNYEFYTTCGVSPPLTTADVCLLYFRDVCIFSGSQPSILAILALIQSPSKGPRGPLLKDLQDKDGPMYCPLEALYSDLEGNNGLPDHALTGSAMLRRCRRRWLLPLAVAIAGLGSCSFVSGCLGDGENQLFLFPISKRNLTSGGFPDLVRLRPQGALSGEEHSGVNP